MNFDLAKTPLYKGVNRLEASAGTGKTFALAGLFLRLLLEEAVSARDILVVTFTEAATAELRERIRARLSEASAVLGGQETTDPLLLSLLGKLQTRKSAAARSLRNALEMFDLVSIYTIHGFCQRTLQDSAFESGILFDTELITDQEELIRQVAADYCRKELLRPDELIASAGVQAKLDPDSLARLLKQYLTYPELELVVADQPRKPEAIEQDLRAAFSECVEAWKVVKQGREGLVNYFVAGKKWATGQHAKRDVVDVYAGYLESCQNATSVSAEYWDAVQFFSASAVLEDKGSNKEMPNGRPGLFDPCERLVGLIAEYRTAHRLNFLQGAGKLLSERKQEAKQQSYDDLITRLAGALESPSGSALAKSVRRRYRAALIDESQDTDPLQWRIFRRVFAESQDHWLYLIGDPKQAIYGFRGADVNTYLEAAATAKQEYSLGTNWRSESALVHAVNALFSSAGKTTAFVEDRITFGPVEPGPKADREPIMFPPEGQRPPPLQVWCWEPANGNVSSKRAQRELPGVTAGEIARLLNQKTMLGDRRSIQPRDVAILVESHKQARWMQSALHDLRIPSVGQAMESVFESDEARELQWILAAILAPGREAAVKSALTTDALGLNGSGLQALVADESRWQHRLQGFAQYRQIWEQDGFFAMFMQLLRREQVIESLLRFPDAERRITNLLHVAELLEAACKSEHLGPSRLVQWLEERRNAEESASEEFQLRLESDEDAVQIVTIHRAKGLEYPVVFCPFISKDAKLRQIKVNGQKVADLVLYHDPLTARLSWDISGEPDDGSIRLAQKEQLAEKVRLLYVALTRARNRCYVVSARYSRNKSTALAWLLHRPGGMPDDPVAGLNEEELAPGAWKTRWQEIAALSLELSGGKPGIAVDDLPATPGQKWSSQPAPAEDLKARSCSRKIEPSWFLSSFSQVAEQISSRAATEAESGLPDHDELAGWQASAAAREGMQGVATGIFALPASSRTGDCLHKILERLDFADASQEGTEGLVRQQMEACNLWEPSHAMAVVAMLHRLRQVPMDSTKPEFTLARISAGQRLTELEFHFPAARFDGRKLLALVRSAGNSKGSEPDVPARHLQAFLKGFIDLVFQFEGRYHIVDWKSNLLGITTEEYTQETMRAEVLANYYDLQYHIYTLALDKFLRQRLPEYNYDRHFGGVHYVFLRGLDPARPQLGIFHDRPSKSSVESLSSFFGNIAEDQQ